LLLGRQCEKGMLLLSATLPPALRRWWRKLCWWLLC